MPRPDGMCQRGVSSSTPTLLKSNGVLKSCAKAVGSHWVFPKDVNILGGILGNVQELLGRLGADSISFRAEATGCRVPTAKRGVSTWRCAERPRAWNSV